MAVHTAGIERLIDLFGRFPGIGARTAERMAYHVLKQGQRDAQALADAIHEVIHRTGPCKICFNYAQAEHCEICSNPRRDPTVVCVVEHPSDVVSIEKAGVYRGVYHVLLGRIAPLEGVGPEDIKIGELLARVGEGRIVEVILATNPTMEGDSTANHICGLLAPTGVKRTRIARGLPAGSNLEYASKAIVSDAIEGRRPL